jgi:rod shape-determining protein MreB
MDLGAFKTSVASSAGLRDVMFSAVGWPKDRIARTLLGRDVVFGKDLIEHRLALNVIRPFEKGALKYTDIQTAGVAPERIEHYREAARLLVEHAVAQVRPSPGVPVYGVIGAPSRASIGNKKVILQAAAQAFDAVMIVSEPFTIAYGMNRLSDTLVVDLGAGTIDLCPIYGTLPSDEDQVTLPLGGDFIDDAFLRMVKQAHPEVQLTPLMAREIKEKYGFVHNSNERAIVRLPAGGRPRPYDLTDMLKQACSWIVGPIVEALREMMMRFDPEFQHRLLHNIILGGGGSQLKGLDLMIEEGLKEFGPVRVRKVGDAVYAGAMGALKLAMSLPPECWEALQAQKQAEPVAA